MDFSKALSSLRAGNTVARSGWNGKNMWIVLMPGYPEGIGINEATAKATGQSVGTVCKFHPYILMKTAHGDLVPWLASQTDLLADDWEIAD